jgi:hypothetical protein
VTGWAWFLLVSLVITLGALGYSLLRWDACTVERDRLDRENLWLRGELLAAHGRSDWEW